MEIFLTGLREHVDLMIIIKNVLINVHLETQKLRKQNNNNNNLFINSMAWGGKRVFWELRRLF